MCVCLHTTITLSQPFTMSNTSESTESTMPMFSFNVGPPAEPPAVVAFKQAKAAARQRVIELDRLRREAKDKIVEYEAEMAELSAMLRR